MAAHATESLAVDDRITLGNHAAPLYNAVKIAAVIGLAASLLLGFIHGDALKRFYFAYLTSLGYILSIALGALAFVLLQFVTRAGWSVTVRRIAENIAATLPVIAVASIPILFSVLIQDGDLYPWALPKAAATEAAIKARATGDLPEESEAEAAEAGGTEGTKSDAPKTRRHFLQKKTVDGEPEEKPSRLDPATFIKRSWLNPFFFLFRIVAYFAIWSGIALFYRKLSRDQDESSDVAITFKLQAFSAPCLVILGLTTGFGAFDLLMSLDPHWYSTMFSVYFIAGCLVSSFAAIILVTFLLQKNGFLKGSISVEHYHDLGKYQFAFTFFWGYIAFSQYMLLWYANLPETVVWLSRRGATTANVVAGEGRSWSPVAVTLLFGMLLIPFAGLISRHIKRRLNVLVFWSVWILVFHFVDLYWVVMPELGGFKPHLMDLTCMVGLVGLFAAAVIRNLSVGSLRPTADPRLPEALAFQNI